MPRLVEIVEMPSFLRDVEGILGEPELDELKNFLSANPEAGVVIPGTGGVRKLRVAAQSKGKRGGARVIYYFCDEQMPLYLFKLFTKGSKADLTAAEKKTLSKVVEILVKENRRRK